MAMLASVVLWMMASLSLVAGVRENLARGKPAWMSSIEDPALTASNGVDGVTASSRNFSAHTSLNETSAWWKVDLQTKVQSAVVNIYFRTDETTRRNGLHLYTSETNSSDPKEGHLCYRVTGRSDGTGINDVLNVTCPGTWRYLTAYTETNNDGLGAAIDFVEVEVWTCLSGRYGFSCEKDCNSRHCGLTGASCPSDTGACPSPGCQPWWAGADCTACASGFYGANCNKSCAARHCKLNSVCDVTLGQCVGGCATGYQGTDCMQECNSGNYGANCGQSCAERHCKRSSSCNVIFGQCIGGCAAGFRGTDCRQVCASGLYGDNCTMDCKVRHCRNTGDSCPPSTGACSSSGCQTGWGGLACTVCASGYYGANCDQSCAARHCKINSVCDVTRGQCVDGCEAGYRGTDCKQECPSGRYGANCNSVCGHCADDFPCHHFAGTCLSGCKAGWQLPLCKTTIEKNSAISPVAAAVLGVAAGICFAVILAVILFRVTRQERVKR